MKKVFFIVFVSVCCTVDSATSQVTTTWTEGELALQSKYIEANKHKLIGNIDKALELYDEILSENRDLHPAWYEKARMLHVQENNEDAVIAIDKAIKLDPNNEWYVLFKSDLYERSNQLDLAAQTMEDFISQGNASKELQEELASILQRDQKYGRAVEIYNALEKKYGVNEVYSKAKYSLYLKMNKGDLAVSELEKLISHNPNIEFLHLLAVNYTRQDKSQLAEKIYRQILDIDPDDTRASIAMAQSFREEGNSTSFVKSIQSIISNPDLDIDVKIHELIPQLEKLVDSYSEGLSTELVSSGRILIKTHPENAKASAFLGDVYFHSGQYGKARQTYEKTLSKTQSIYPVWEQYLYTLYYLNAYKKIAEQAELALDIYPNQGRLYLLYSLAKAKSGDLFTSYSLLQHALILSRKDAVLHNDVTILLSIVESMNGQSESGSKRLANLLSENKPNNMAIFQSLIEYNYILQNKSASYLEYFNSIKINTSYYTHYLGAISHFMTGDLVKAKELIDQSIKNTPIMNPRIAGLFMSIHEATSDIDTSDYISIENTLSDMGYTRLDSNSRP